MKKRTKNFILAAAIICIAVGAGLYYFLVWNSVEHLCNSECRSISMQKVFYQESPTYRFAQCTCLSENNSKEKFYFDLDTKEKISSSEVIRRALS